MERKAWKQGAGPVLQEHVAKFKQLRGMLRRPPTCLGRQVSRKPLIALSRLHRGEVGRGMSRGDKVWDRVRRRQAHRRNGGRKRWVMVWLYCAHARLYLLGYTITAPSRWVWGRRSARYPYIRATAKFIITRPYLFHVYRVVSFSYRPVPPTANRQTLLFSNFRENWATLSSIDIREDSSFFSKFSSNKQFLWRITNIRKVFNIFPFFKWRKVVSSSFVSRNVIDQIGPRDENGGT